VSYSRVSRWFFSLSGWIFSPVRVSGRFWAILRLPLGSVARWVRGWAGPFMIGREAIWFHLRFRLLYSQAPTSAFGWCRYHRWRIMTSDYGVSRNERPVLKPIFAEACTKPCGYSNPAAILRLSREVGNFKFRCERWMLGCERV